ncbi:hypothetical protein Tco_0691800 [Tanacetum coccineum]
MVVVDWIFLVEDHPKRSSKGAVQVLIVGEEIVRARVVFRVVFMGWFWMGEDSFDERSMKSVLSIFLGGFWVEELALEAIKMMTKERYGYCKNLKKTVKAEQTRARDGKECTRAEDLIARKGKCKLTTWLCNSSAKVQTGRVIRHMSLSLVNPWYGKKHTRTWDFSLKLVQKKHNESDTWNATLAIRVLTH